MQRRDFLKNTVAVAAAAELGTGKVKAKVPHTTGVSVSSISAPVHRSSIVSIKVRFPSIRLTLSFSLTIW
jgi:hypothetical protein